MKLAFSTRRRIQAPVGLVWETMTDWPRVPEWMRSVERVAPPDGSEAGPGVPLEVVARGKPVDSWLESWRPGELMSVCSRQGGVTARYDYTLSHAAGGTEVRLSAYCASDGLLWRLLSPVLRRAMRWTDGGQLERLVSAETS